MRHLFATAATLVALAFLVPACQRCGALSDKICADLGSANCGLWKEANGPDMTLPGGRGGGRACGMILDNDIAYEGLLNSARGLALTEKLKRAIAKGDKAAIAAVNAELADNKKRVEDGLKKLKR